MRKFLALVWREVVEWRLVLLGGLVVGWMPWIAVWLPAFEGRQPEELREGVAIFSSGLFLVSFLVVLGSSILGRELSEGRLRFYFARPLSVGMVWSAKLAAAILLLLTAFVLLLLPSADLVSEPLFGLFTPGNEPALPLLVPAPGYYQTSSWQLLPGPLSVGWRLLGALWALLLVLAGAHCVSSMVRLRSAWVILDLSGLALVLGLASWAQGELMREQALGPMVWLERSFLLFLPIAFLGAGWHQLQQGRGDPARSHRYLSLALWPSLLLLFLGAAGWAHWVTSDTLADLERVTFAETAPDGPWMMVGGVTPHRAGKTTAFLLDTSTGQTLRLGGLDATAWQFTFSGDGQRAVWVQCDAPEIVDCELWTLNLGVAEMTPRTTGIGLDHFLTHLSLNQDGTRLAVYQNGSLALYELPRGRLMQALRSNEVRAASFLDDGRLRLYIAEETEDAKFHLLIREFDLECGTMETTGTLSDGILGYLPRHGLTADTVLYLSLAPPKLAIAEGRSGKDLMIYPGRPPSAVLLADGTGVLAFREQETLKLLVLSPTGELLHSRVEQGVLEIAMGGELSPGRLVIGLKGSSDGEINPQLTGLHLDPLADWASFLLDTSSGDLIKLTQGLVPLRQMRILRRFRSQMPGSALGRLFQAGEDTLLFWDPDTGEVRSFLGRSSGVP